MNLTQAMYQRGMEMAEDFLLNDKEYQLGFVEAEQSNPLTRGLGETAQADPVKAVEMVFKVDRHLTDTFESVTTTAAYHIFCARVERTLRGNGRILISGCGSTGRLALNLEACWRRALRALRRDAPLDVLARLTDLENRVVTIMTGGDYALIKSVESFEDFAQLGAEQARLLHAEPGDLLVGITATAETTSILGTALAAAQAGADVEMVVCSDPAAASARLARSREVFSHPRVHSLYLPCGAMAVTGSTRMQSSTIEQLACGSAMEAALCHLLGEWGIPLRAPDPAAAFAAMVDQLLTPAVTKAVGEHASLEAELYRQGQRVTYFAETYLLDILSDTTERSPTFMVPPFAPDGSDASPSWAFVKNPACDTAQAWERCLMHAPRCIDWTLTDYRRLGVSLTQAPAISRSDLMRYRIGNEPCAEREAGESLAVWIGETAAPDAFTRARTAYFDWTSLTLEELSVSVSSGPLKLMEHLAIKLILNAFSTVTMGCMGRITGNYMTWMDMSNKKLVDRSARLIAQECSISYPDALRELFITKAWMDENADPASGSPAQQTIRRLYGEADQ